MYMGGGPRKSWGMGQNDEFAFGVLKKHGVWAKMMNLEAGGGFQKKHGVWAKMTSLHWGFQKNMGYGPK